MARTYTPRYSCEKAPSLSFAKQPVDDLILEAVATYRLVSTSLLALLLGIKASWLPSRLHKLYKFGYLQRFKAGSREIVYAPASLARGKAPYLDHDLMSTRLWVSLELCARHCPTLEFDWKPGWMLRSDGGGVIPDATLRLYHIKSDGKRASALYHLEADHATESPARVMEKFRGYVTWWDDIHAADANAQPFGVLFVASSEARMNSIRKAVVRELGNHRLFWFGCEAWYSPQDPATVSGPIWMRALGDRKHAFFT